jgi:hypothetical protein
LVKVLKRGAGSADNSKAMGAPAVTTTPLPLRPPRPPRQSNDGMRRTGIWTSIVGGVLTLVGGLTVLVTHDDPSTSSKVLAENRPVPVTLADGTAATPGVASPDRNRPPGNLSTGTQPGRPGLPPLPAAPPATPQQVAELLAGLPLQLEQAADAGGQPHELTPEEVNKVVDDLLRQLGAKP